MPRRYFTRYKSELSYPDVAVAFALVVDSTLNFLNAPRVYYRVSIATENARWRITFVPIRKFLAIRSTTMVDSAYLQFIRTFARICQLNEIFQTENRQEKRISRSGFWKSFMRVWRRFEEAFEEIQENKCTVIENFELSKNCRKMWRQIT